MNRFAVKVLNRLKFLKFINTSTSITVNNKKIHLPIIHALGSQHMYMFEPWMIRLLQKLKPLFPGHFVDVGVNMGQTLLKVQSVFDKPTYLGFEPNAFCIAYVDEMIKLNKWEHCNIIPAGVSKDSGLLKLNFFHAENTDSTATTIEDFRDNVARSVYIPVLNEQHLKPLLPPVKNSFLKIDVEGGELEVIEGLRSWIREFRPVILAEVLLVNGKPFRIQRQEKLESVLKEMDYVFFRINKQNITVKQLATIGIHSNEEDVDYVICPAEISANISQLLN